MDPKVAQRLANMKKREEAMRLKELAAQGKKNPPAPAAVKTPSAAPQIPKQASVPGKIASPSRPGSPWFFLMHPGSQELETKSSSHQIYYAGDPRKAGMAGNTTPHPHPMVREDKAGFSCDGHCHRTGLSNADQRWRSSVLQGAFTVCGPCMQESFRLAPLAKTAPLPSKVTPSKPGPAKGVLEKEYKANEANVLKDRGNGAFHTGNFKEAARLFSEAIQLDPQNHILYSNRAGAFASLGQWERSLEDSIKTTELKPDWPKVGVTSLKTKGWGRKGLAYLKLDQPAEAVSAYEEGLRLEPVNAELKEGVRAALRAQAERGPQVPERRRNPAIYLKNRQAPRQREVRVFISSTFKDMQAERSYLAQHIFPQLEAFCAERNVRFTTVDLRWGITSLDSQSGRVISLCLNEIDLCRPYFVSFIGERYGWSQASGSSDKILAQSFANAMREHPWLEPYQNRSVTELEILYGALLQDRNVSKVPPDPSHCFLYLRDPEVSRKGGPDFVESSQESMEKLKDLKQRVRESYCPLKDYRQPEELGQSLLEQLRTVIDEDFPKDDMPPAQRENHAHLMYAESLLSVHLPRLSHLKQMESFCRPGTAGLGKGHFMASWFADHHQFDKKILRVAHFLQAGSRGNPLSVMLTRLLTAMKDHFRWSLPIPEGLTQLLVEFPAWLQRTGTVAGQRGRVCFAIDGLDQCSDPVAQELRWLPKVLPKSVKLILTARPGPMLDRLKARGATVVELNPLTDDELDSFATDHLAKYGKKLTPAQKQDLIACNTAPVRNPLFLRTMLDQLRVQSTFETLGSDLDRYLSAKSPEELFLGIISSWEKEASRSLVSDVLSLLWCSKYGLTERELVEMLKLDQHQNFQYLWVNLTPHLVSRGGVFRFSNPYVASAVQQKYISGEEAQKNFAQRMIEYFDSIPMSRRKAHELPHLFVTSGQNRRLASFLSQLDAFAYLSGPDYRTDLTTYWKTANGGLHRPDLIVQAMRQSVDQLVGSEKRSQHSDRLIRLTGLFFMDLGENEAARELFQRLTADSTKNQKNGQVAVEDLVNLAKSLVELGKFTEAATAAGAARRLAEQAHGRLTLETAEAVFLQGVVRKKQGKYSDARLHYDTAMRTAESLFGPRHPRVAIYFNAYADVLRKLDFFEKALEIYSKSLTTFEIVLGEDSLQVAEVLRDIGLVHKKQGAYEQAEAEYRRAISIVENLYGSEHIKLGIFLNDLADTYRKRGKNDEAMALYRRSLEITTKHLGNSHPDVADICSSMGLVEKKRGNYDSAEGHYKEAIAKILDRLGASHPKHGLLINNLADIARKRGHYAQAEDLYKQSLSILERALGLEHLEVAEVLNNLGVLYKKLGKYSEARPLYERGMRIIGDAFGTEHFKYGLILNNLADVCRKVGDYDTALAYYEQSLANLTSSLGEGHLETADPWDGIGRVHSKLSHWKESIAAFQSALTIVEKSVGREHYKYGMFLGNLGDTRRKQGDLRRSQEDLDTAVPIVERALGASHPETGDLLLYRGRYVPSSHLDRLRRAIGHVQADNDLKRALKIVEESVGLGHPKYQEVQRALTEVVLPQGQQAAPASRGGQSRPSGSMQAVPEVWSPWGMVPIIPRELRTPRPTPASSRAPSRAAAGTGSAAAPSTPWGAIPFSS